VKFIITLGLELLGYCTTATQRYYTRENDPPVGFALYCVA
jgi:hypothetical protein